MAVNFAVIFFHKSENAIQPEYHIMFDDIFSYFDFCILVNACHYFIWLLIGIKIHIRSIVLLIFIRIGSFRLSAS